MPGDDALKVGDDLGGAHRVHHLAACELGADNGEAAWWSEKARWASLIASWAAFEARS